jgi:hypothetical protein
MFHRADDIAYQIRVAGQPEREVSTGTGRTVWADGYRSQDGALVDAKHIRNSGCSPRTLQGLIENDRATGFVRGPTRTSWPLRPGDRQPGQPRPVP